MDDLPDLHCTAPCQSPKKLNPQHSESQRFIRQSDVFKSSSGSAFALGRFQRAISTIELMDPNTSAIERAFQLAKAGQCASVQDIMRKLKSEGYSVERLLGSSLIKQLSAMIFASRR